jgi:hypothetical protein
MHKAIYLTLRAVLLSLYVILLYSLNEQFSACAVYRLYCLYELLQALRDGISDMRGIAIVIAQASHRGGSGSSPGQVMWDLCGQSGTGQVLYSRSTLIIIHYPGPGFTYQMDSLQELKTKETKLHGLSPRANYTDQATAACRRSDCQLLRIEGATWSA